MTTLTILIVVREKLSDSMSQAGDSYGASSDDTQSGESASQEGSPNYDTNDLGASNNLAENSDSGSEIYFSHLLQVKTQNNR